MGIIMAISITIMMIGMIALIISVMPFVCAAYTDGEPNCVGIGEPNCCGPKGCAPGEPS